MPFKITLWQENLAVSGQLQLGCNNCFLLPCRADWTNLTIANHIISTVIEDQTGIFVKSHVTTNSGEILNRHALVDAICNAIVHGNYYNAGYTITLPSSTCTDQDPTTGKIEEGSLQLDGNNVTIIVVICIIGLIVILALILAIVVYIMRK